MNGRPDRSTVPWALAGLTVLGLAVRFSSLGVQSYHHDEVITIVRILSEGFRHMLHSVRTSESTPPLYYVVAWVWAKLFGTGEVGLRSLSALLGSATVPVAFLAGREALAGRTRPDAPANRVGLISAALVALNPMLIWYSQEARSYAMLIFFCSLSLLFFLRALHGARARDLICWGVASTAALCSHYFAGFPVAIEAAWLLVALRSRWRRVLPVVGGTALIGLALLPLLRSQVSTSKTGWLHHIAFSSRVFQTSISFLAGETGGLIEQAPQEGYALIPAILIAVALVLLAVRGSQRERFSALPPLAVGLWAALVPIFMALTGTDYVLDRNLLPALVPLLIVSAIGFSATRARLTGSVCAAALCVYWLAFAIYVPFTPSLQRPDWRDLAGQLDRPHGPRAIVLHKLDAPVLTFYLPDRSKRVKSDVTVREIDLVARPPASVSIAMLPLGFHEVDQVRVQQQTLTRYRSERIRKVSFRELKRLPTGFGANAVVVDGAAAGRGDSQRPFEAQVHVTPVDGTRIAWYERGAGPPLVMLIGTGSTMAEWDPALLWLLARRSRLILFDYPGVGRSGPWRGDSFDSLADTTAGLMRAIDVPRADVLGWSMGGFVAQRLAVDHPEAVSHLILAGTNPGGDRAVLGTPKAQAIDSEPNPSDATILRELYPPGHQGEGHRFLRRLVRASQSGEIPDDFHVPTAITDAQVAAEDPWLRSDRNYRQLAAVGAPTLAAAGAADPVVPPVNLRRIAARIPRTRLIVFPGAHAFLFQDRRAFTHAVDELLSR